MKGSWNYTLSGSGPENGMVLFKIRRNDNGELLIGDTICVRYTPSFQDCHMETAVKPRREPAATTR